MTLVVVVLGFLQFFLRIRGGSSSSKLLRNSAFDSITRRSLLQCEDPNPLLNMTLDTAGPLENVHNVMVTVSGILEPSSHDWIGVFTQASHNYSDCPSKKSLYLQTGDTSSMPLLCDYPLKFKFVRDDRGYLSCKKSTCVNKSCTVKTCSGSVLFRLINIRTDITFVFFTGGLTVPCILKISQPLSFSAPEAPVYGHLSLADSSGTSMILSWISNSSDFQFVEYANDQVAKASVDRYEQDDMCASGPAKDYGWHNPGAIHIAKMTKLFPGTTYSYRYGSNAVGWSSTKTFTTPPARGSYETKFVMYGDMGKAERDKSLEHYIQPGALQVIDALEKEAVDAVFHIGDLSYATGFLAEWENFLEMIEPTASRVPYMTAIGNHERDYPSSGSKYSTPDSGGECGVPYEMYFRMPSQGRDKPWYSIAMGPVHLTVISTEHDWSLASEQYGWIKHDLASVDRRSTPWIVLTGHRPMYSTQESSGLLARVLPAVDPSFAVAIEPLLKINKVDLAVWGHVHNYERTCALFQGRCLIPPLINKDASGVHVLNSSVYSAPVHAVVGMAGFSLDAFPKTANEWSLVRVAKFGFARITANKKELLLEYVTTHNGAIADRFKLVKF